MKINILSLPHPVLGRKDDVDGKYEVDASWELGREKIKLNILHKLVNNTLREMMKNNKVNFCTEVACAKTHYRNTFVSSEDKQEIILSASDLRDKVDVNFFITAKENMGNYKIDGANSDYGNNLFEIEKGDVLAYGGTTFFIAAKAYALMTVASFMVIDKYDEQEGPIHIDLEDDDKVIIRMSNSDYERYNIEKGYKDMYPIFHSSIVFPALLHILYSMKNNSSSYESRAWFENLNYRLKNEEIFKKRNLSINNTNDIPKIAQLFLGNPVNRSLNSIENIINEVENN